MFVGEDPEILELTNDFFAGDGDGEAFTLRRWSGRRVLRTFTSWIESYVGVAVSMMNVFVDFNVYLMCLTMKGLLMSTCGTSRKSVTGDCW
jgi:hypothetical protein